MLKDGKMQRLVMGALVVIMVASLALALAAFVAVPFAQARSVSPDSPCESCWTISQGWHCNVCPEPWYPDEQYEVVRCCD